MTKEEIEALGPDQQALGGTGACKQKKDKKLGLIHAGIRILPSYFFWLPTSSGIKKGLAREFVHFTNTGRWKLISHKLIKKYVEGLGVPADIDPMGKVRDQTCASEFAQPL